MAGEWRRKDPGDTLVEPPMWEASPQKSQITRRGAFWFEEVLKKLSNSVELIIRPSAFPSSHSRSPKESFQNEKNYAALFFRCTAMIAKVAIFGCNTDATSDARARVKSKYFRHPGITGCGKWCGSNAQICIPPITARPNLEFPTPSPSLKDSSSATKLSKSTIHR